MAMMMNELDFSRDKTGDMSNEQEEIQIFNNRLFSPSRRPDNSMTQPAPFDDQSPIRASRGLGSAGRDDTDNLKWLDPEQLHKDTLDLNYQAELNNSQRNRMTNLSNQSSRLEDLLREADLAVKKSQGLTTKVQNENYQSSYTPSYQSDYRFSSIPYSSSGQDRFSSTPSYFNNPLPQQQNYYPSNPTYGENQSPTLNRPSQAPLNSYTDPAWITVKQQQPQGSWATESSLSDPRLSAKASKSGRTYDLFPIQEAAETGAETPRVIKKSQVNYSESPNQNYGVYNFGGPSSLADKVLNMNPDSRGPASYSSAERPKQTSYQNAANNGYSKPVSTWGSSNPEFGLQPKTLGGDIRHSMGPIEEDSRENLPTFHGPGHDSMDKKVDEIIQRHISGNTFEDNQGVPNNNLRNSNLRNSNLRNSNIQQQEDLDPYNETPQGFAPTSGFSGEPARPFSAYDVSPGPVPNRLSQSTTFPNQGIERGSVPLKEVPTNNMFLSEARRTKSEVNFEQQPLYLTSPKPSGSQYEEGVYPTWSTSKTENRFTSPLLQKYSNPFLNEHLMTLTSPKVVGHGDHEDMRHSPQEMYHHHGGEEKVKAHGHHVNASGSVMGVTDPLFQKDDLRNIDIIKRVRRDNTIILKKPQKPVVQTFRAGELEDDLEPQHSYRAGELIDDHESPKVRNFPTEFHGPYKAGDLEDDHDSFTMGSKKKSSPGRPGVRSYDPASMTSEENFDAEMYFQNQYDMAPAQEISPDKKMKKLTFKNRPSEEKSAERRGFDPISEREDLTLSQEPTIGKQRRKIFESKLPDPEPRHSHQLLSASMGRDSEKSRRLIFSDIKEKHIKDIDHVADPWEENIHTNEADEGNPSENVKKAHASPGAKLGDLNREKPSTLNDLGYPRPNEDDDYGYFDENDKLPYQLHNGAMDISQSFFDFENEKAFGQDEFAGGPRGTTSQRGKKVNAAAPPQNLAASNRNQAQKPVGKIWVLDTSQQSAGRGLTNSQTLNQSLKKVPLLTHCFEKFEGINEGFPKV